MSPEGYVIEETYNEMVAYKNDKIAAAEQAFDRMFKMGKAETERLEHELAIANTKVHDLMVGQRAAST